MAFMKGLVLGSIIVISVSQYIRDDLLGCKGVIYWNFDETLTVDVIALNDVLNKEVVCKEACNNNDNCNAWGIYVNDDQFCNLFDINNKGLLYNCQLNDITKYYGQVKQCPNKDLTTSNIAKMNHEKADSKLVYDPDTKCFTKMKFLKGIKSYLYICLYITTIEN